MAKYPWGDAPFTTPFVLVCMVAFGLLLGGVLAYMGPADTLSEGYPEPKELYGVVGVCCAWVVMWYLFLGLQVQVKMASLEPEVAKQVSYICDRTVINTSEQAYVFFAMLWAHAVFVNPKTSAAIGWMYVAGRFTYPVMYGIYGGFTNLVEVPAQMGYACNMWLLCALVYRVAFHSDLHSDLPPMLLPPAAVAVAAVALVLLVAAPGPMFKPIVRGVTWEKQYKPPLASQ